MTRELHLKQVNEYVHVYTYKWTTDLNGKPEATNLLKEIGKIFTTLG